MEGVAILKLQTLTFLIKLEIDLIKGVIEFIER